MEIVLLGTGTAVPVPDRFPSGVLVRDGAQTLLVDCGPGVLRRLAQTGVDLREVTTVLLTHYHTDHTADLAALLFALRNPRYAGRGPLRLRGAPGLAALLGNLTAAWPWLSPKGYVLDVVEIEPGRVPLDASGTVVDAFRVEHTSASLAYRITGAGGGVATFSGDADVCDGLVDAARNADLFVCDAAFPDEGRVEGHLTPGLAGQHAQAAGARSLCLTHFYPECDGVDLAAQARATFDGEVVLGADLMRFTVLPGATSSIRATP